MKNILIKTICITLIIISIIFSTIIIANSYDIYTYTLYSNLNNVLLLNSQNQTYLIGTNGKEVQIDAVYPDMYNINLKLNNNVYSYSLCNNTLVFVCPIRSSNQTEIVLYDINTDLLTSFIINGTHQIEGTKIVYANGYVYFTSNNSIKQYSSIGKLINTYDSFNNLTYLTCDFNDKVYALNNSGVYHISSSTVNRISITSFNTYARFIDNNLLVDAHGNNYSVNNNFVEKISKYRSSISFPSGGIYKKRLIISDNNTLYAVNVNNSIKTRQLSLQSYIEQFYTINNTIVALVYQYGSPTICIIPYSELLEIKTNNHTSDNNTDVTNNNSTNSDPSGNDSEQTSNNKSYTITSDVYKIDNKEYKITGISPSTTAAVFKRNMNYEGYEVEFIKYGGKYFTSGNVGTATIARFYNENSVYKYELSVVGDITGEGNVNTRDEASMFDYLLENINFTGVFIDSADLDSNSKIDVTDLVLLLRLIENQK